MHYEFLPVPNISVISPFNGELVTTSPITVTGEVYNASEVTVNGRSAILNGNTFSVPLDLVEGDNTIIVIAKNAARGAAETLTVNFQPSFALSSLVIEATTNQVPLGEDLQLRAVGTQANGAVVDLTQESVWSSSTPAVATVSSTGFVTSLDRGNTTLSASFGGLTANFSLAVGNVALQAIQIAHEELFVLVSTRPQLTLDPPTLEVEESVVLVPLGSFSNGDLSDLRSPLFFGAFQIAYASSDPTVATVDASGVVTALKVGTTELSATSIGVTGTTTLTVIPPPMFLFITDPLDGSTVARDEVTVQGTVITGAPEVGITVNGILANVFGNKFVVNGVPLELGNNTLTAVGTDSNGATAAAEVVVGSFPAADEITLRANIESGIAPLDITLTIDSTFGEFSASTLSFSGPTAPQITQVSPEEYQVTLTTKGIYTFTAQVTDDQGTSHTDSVAVVVLNRTDVESLLITKWEDMQAALLSGDLDGAMTYFAGRSQERFSSMFQQIQSLLPDAFGSIEDVHLLFVRNGEAEMEAIRTEGGITYSYPIVFIQDETGTWKLWGF